MGALRWTDMTLQMIDDSGRFSLDILEDVPVRVEKFLISVTFVVLDILEDVRTPNILCRPFLHTVGALIDVGK
ncbi:hypothetical protein vseg_019698 [Gypsophila vaccaria]